MALLVFVVSYVPWQIWVICGFLITLNAMLK